MKKLSLAGLQLQILCQKLLVRQDSVVTHQFSTILRHKTSVHETALVSSPFIATFSSIRHARDGHAAVALYPSPVQDQIQDLQQILKLDEAKAVFMIKKHPQLQQILPDQICERIDTLSSMSISLERVVLMPWLLYMDLETVQKSAELLEKGLGLRYEVGVAFTYLRTHSIRRMIIMWKMKDGLAFAELGLKFKTRIAYFCHFLQCSDVQVADMMAKVSRLATLSLERIHEHMIVLQDGEVSSEHIVEDPWIFLHNIEVIKSRLNILKKIGVTCIKPWALRTAEDNFSLYLRYRKEEIIVREETGSDIKQVLQNTLPCSPDLAESIMRKCFFLSSAKPSKIKSRIDSLSNLGYTTEEMIAVPTILSKSAKLIRNRYEQVRNLGVEKPPLYELYKNTTNYDAYVTRLKKRTTPVNSNR